MKNQNVLSMLFCGILFCAFPAAAEDSVQMQSLKDQIQDLQMQVEGLKVNRSPDQQGAEKLGSLKYKGVTIQLGGFLASESVYRSNNMASDIGTNYSKIPFANSAGYGVTEFRGTERQSRFSLLATGDYDSNTHLAGYYEMDFLGASPYSNANESNSYSPRTRNVYMTIDWDDPGIHILAGQNWSLATLNTQGITPRNEYIPATIDAQYAVGFNWARQWQLRVVKDWEKKFWLALSLENAQTVGVAGSLSGQPIGNTYQLPPGALMAANLSMNSYPDVISKFAYESDYGHYEVYGLARNFQSRFGGNAASSQVNKQSTWVEDVGAGATVPVLPKRIDISLSGLYGRGIGRYGTVGLPDASYAFDGSLDPLMGLQYLAQIAWHVNKNFDAYATYGVETVQASSASGNVFGYGNGSVSSNSGCTILGSTACTPDLKDVAQLNLGFWWTFYKGEYGAVKLGGQYSHTNVNTFADASGFAPNTKEDMVFTSLRYFPF